MLRASRKTVVLVQNPHLRKQLVHPRRCFSEVDTKKEPCGMVLLAKYTGVTLVTACGLTLLGAKFNSKFRNGFEYYVPGSKSLFGFVLGAAQEVKEEKTIKLPSITKVVSDPLEKPMSKTTLAKSETIVQESVKAQTALTDDPQREPKTISTLHPKPPEDNTEPLVSEVKVTNSPAISPTKDPSSPTKSIPLTVKISDSSVQSPSDEIDPFVKISSCKSNTDPNADCNCPQETSKQQVKNVMAEINGDVKMQYQASSVIVDDLLSNCSVACANAIIISNAAAEALADHSSLLRTALDDNKASPDEKSRQWCDVSLAQHEKEMKLGEADVFYQTAIEEITKLMHVLDELKKDSVIDEQKTAEIERNCFTLTQDLENAKAKVASGQLDAEELDKYFTSVDKAKLELRQNYKLPEYKVMEEWKREGSQLGSGKVDVLRNLQQKLEEMRKRLEVEKENAARRLEETSEVVEAKTRELMSREFENEKEKIKEDSRREFEKEITQIRESYDEEIESRLKQQSRTHAQHLAEAMQCMDQEAKKKYEEMLQIEIENHLKNFQEAMEKQRLTYADDMNSVREQYQLDLNLMMASVEGIKKAISGRSYIENETRKAQELSLACDSLLASLKYGNRGKPLPLKAHIATIRNVYEDHQSINTISSCLSEEAQERGVYSEDAIKNKFQAVSKICRRLSLVDDKNNSLYVYILSCLKITNNFATYSTIIIDRSPTYGSFGRPHYGKKENNVLPMSFLIKSNAALQPPDHIEPSELDCFTILSYANYCLQHGDMVQAVRFINQLKGEARNVAEGWLKEARLYLETKQSVDALCAIAHGIVVGAQLES